MLLLGVAANLLILAVVLGLVVLVDKQSASAFGTEFRGADALAGFVGGHRCRRYVGSLAPGLRTVAG